MMKGIATQLKQLTRKVDAPALYPWRYAGKFSAKSRNA